MTYTTQHICSMFRISHQTAKNWAREFASYLSPTATPDKNRQRVFTDEDVRVFALVHQFRLAGKFFEDAHAALASGERGDIPSTAGEIVPTTTPAVIAMQERLDTLEIELREALSDADQQRGMVKLLKEQLTDANAEIRRLYRELAEKEARMDDD